MLEAVKTGEKLKRYRRAAALTQRDLGERADVAQATIAEIEGGRIREPRPRTLKALADALDVTPLDLLDDVGE